jgi:arginase
MPATAARPTPAFPVALVAPSQPGAKPDGQPPRDVVHAVRILGVPLDFGASRRGVDMGPSALRVAQLAERLRELGHTVADGGNVPVPDRAEFTCRGAEFLPVIAAVCRGLAERTAAAVRDGALPLVLGGDHSLAAGSVAGVATALAERGGRLGLIWLDAHADIHTPDTSHTGNVHGMPLAHLLGHGDPRLAGIAAPGPAVRPEHVALVGVRDLDLPERRRIRELGVTAFTMRDVDERGLKAVMADALAVASRGTAGVHVSCDVDWIDPSDAPGVGTPVRGGATYREAHLAMELVSDAGLLVGMDVVEVNPVLDRHNRTAELAVDLVASAFGRRIL